MTVQNIIYLSGWIVYVDVYVELVRGAINMNLAFGPFLTRAEAELWSGEMSMIHAVRQMDTPEVEFVPLDKHGLPVKPYLDMHMSISLLTEMALARKYADSLFAPGVPDQDEAKLADYAIRACAAQLAYAEHLLGSGA